MLILMLMHWQILQNQCIRISIDLMQIFWHALALALV